MKTMKALYMNIPEDPLDLGKKITAKDYVASKYYFLLYLHQGICIYFKSTR